jgi:hypothetical protein
LFKSDECSGDHSKWNASAVDACGPLSLLRRFANVTVTTSAESQNTLIVPAIPLDWKIQSIEQAAKPNFLGP